MEQSVVGVLKELAVRDAVVAAENEVVASDGDSGAPENKLLQFCRRTPSACCPVIQVPSL